MTEQRENRRQKERNHGSLPKKSRRPSDCCDASQLSVRTSLTPHISHTTWGVVLPSLREEVERSFGIGHKMLDFYGLSAILWFRRAGRLKRHGQIHWSPTRLGRTATISGGACVCLRYQ